MPAWANLYVCICVSDYCKMQSCLDRVHLRTMGSSAEPRGGGSCSPTTMQWKSLIMFQLESCMHCLTHSSKLWSICHNVSIWLHVFVCLEWALCTHQPQQINPLWVKLIAILPISKDTHGVSYGLCIPHTLSLLHNSWCFSLLCHWLTSIKTSKLFIVFHMILPNLKNIRNIGSNKY